MSPTVPTPDLDAGIDRLAGECTLQDSERLVALLRAFPQATADQMLRLWKIAVTQSAFADVQRAGGDGTRSLRESQQRWTDIDQTLQKTILEDVPGIEEKLSTYREESRAATACPPFASRVQHLETALRRQVSLIGFHHAADENAYRQREAQLSERLTAPASASDQRLSAEQLLQEIARYEAVFLPKLDALEGEVAQAFSECKPFIEFFAECHHPEVHRWQALTRNLIDARSAAVVQIRKMLEFDRFLPGEVLAGATTTDVIDGKATQVLSSESTARLKELVVEIASLFADSAHKESEIGEERDSFCQQIIGTQDVGAPEPTDPAQMKEHAAKRSHPLERRPWYRLAKLCWWGTLLLWTAFSLLASLDWPQFIFIAGCGVGVLYAIKAAVFYVALGRTTLHEPEGSGFIDLDMFEQTIFEQGDTSPNSDCQKMIREFRTRYGARVPATIIDSFVKGQLLSVAQQRKQILTDADRQGRSISVQSLRASIIAAKPSGADPDEYRVHWERLLLRLEVKHGPDIPIMAVDAEADALSAT